MSIGLNLFAEAIVHLQPPVLCVRRLIGAVQLHALAGVQRDRQLALFVLLRELALVH